MKVSIASCYDGNEGYDDSLKPTPCDDVSVLVGALSRKRKLSQPAIDCFITGLAVSISLKVPGPLLWVHFVGPSSSLKTTLAKLIAAASDKCFSVSKFNGLYSGYKSGGQDNSLVPKLQNRVLVINDLTPLLQSDKGTQDEVFGQLRDIYDGSGGAYYKNGVNPQYDGVLFGCITCTTDTIRQFSRSDLGERFLMAEINADYDEYGRFRPVKTDTSIEGNAFNSVLDTIATGLDRSPDSPPSMDNLADERAMCWGFINHLHEWVSDEGSNLADVARAIGQDSSFKAEVEALADWMEHARCPIPTKNEDINVRRRPALPHRSIGQLTKLALCYCIVHKSFGLTPDIKRMVRNRAFDTCHSYPLEIMNYLACHPRFPKELLALKVNLSPTRVAYICDHLISIGVLQQSLENNGTGNRGRHAVCYSLTQPFREYADTIGLLEIKRSYIDSDAPRRPVGLRAVVARNTLEQKAEVAALQQNLTAIQRGLGQIVYPEELAPKPEVSSLLRRIREGRATG